MLRFRDMNKEKLVRDLVSGNRTAKPPELPSLLANKILEEAQELSNAILNGDKTDIVEGIADVREVTKTIARQFHIEEGQIIFRSDKKRKEKGGFTRGNVRRIKGS